MPTPPIFAEPCPACGETLDVCPLSLFEDIDWRRQGEDDSRFNAGTLSPRLPFVEIECPVCGAELCAALLVRVVRRPEDALPPDARNVRVSEDFVGQRRFSVAAPPPDMEGEAPLGPNPQGAAAAKALLHRILGVGQHITPMDWHAACGVAGDELYEAVGKPLRDFAALLGFKVPQRGSLPEKAPQPGGPPRREARGTPPPAADPPEPPVYFCPTHPGRRVPSAGAACMLCTTVRKEPDADG